MKSNPALSTQARRVQRLVLWAALWLAAAGAFVAGALTQLRAERWCHASLARLVPRVAQIVAFCMLLEAMLIARKRVRQGSRSLKQQMRALIGPAIRRLLRRNGDTMAQWIARLAHILQNRAAIVAELVRRITRGLTHAHVAPPRACNSILLPRSHEVLSLCDRS